jgi:hypothetical protein
MSEFKLISANDVGPLMADLFTSQEDCSVEVLEEDCFKDGAYLPLGEIKLRKSSQDNDTLVRAVKMGTYEWTLPSLQNVKRDILDLLQVKKPEDSNKNKIESYDKALKRVDKCLDCLAALVVRVGLAHPIFDPMSVEEMSTLRGTTVVADTSSVLQGGLSFVARFLHPAVRMKIPAIVHMEIVNQADNFLKRRRGNKINSSALLVDHVLSQSGQRVLLDLEMRNDTEVERNPLAGDILRSAFLKDGDSEVSDLNLSVAFRSYCDRLILEAARQHQISSNPGHNVLLLTGDQGLARMALAEGIAPLYHKHLAAENIFGRRFTGTMFNPLSAVLYRIPLPILVWELATAFGRSRLISKDRARFIEVAAIGSELSWSPVHSRNDLLWARASGLSPLTRNGSSKPLAPNDSSTKISSNRGSAAATAEIKSKSARPRSTIIKKITSPNPAAFYRFNVTRMLYLLSVLYEEVGKLSAKTVTHLLGATSPEDYRRFLTAGKFVEVNESVGWQLSEAGLSLSAAIRNGDLSSIRTSLRSVRTLAAFLEALEAREIGELVAVAIPERSRTTYFRIAEILCTAAPIYGKGYFPTYERPPLSSFVEKALSCFEILNVGDSYISVGAWLEALVELHGIHPVRAREALAEAAAGGMLKVSTEGSTLDTRHDSHSIDVLGKLNGHPTVKTIHLYRGDFLTGNKSSSSIRLERLKN